MKHYALLLLSLVFLTSCNWQTSTGPKENSSARQVPDTLTGDPTFVRSKDTVSPYGPNSITRNMLQDKNGNYWLATWQGIIRYDGKLFTNMTLKEGLKHYHVFSAMEDSKGNIWFGTIGGGLYRYDGSSFTHFAMTDGLAGNMVMCLSEDKNGNIWVGTYGGLSRYNEHGIGAKKFTSFTEHDGLAGDRVFSIMQDKNGRLWIGTGSGISCGDPSVLPGSTSKAFTGFTKTDGSPFSNVRSIAADRNGNTWIGGEDGLYRYDGRSLTQVKTGFIGYVFEDKAGNLWVSAGNTPDMVLCRYDGKIFTDVLAKHGRREPQVFGITEDTHGNIWFGTVNGAGSYNGLFLTSYAPPRQ